MAALYCLANQHSEQADGHCAITAARRRCSSVAPRTNPAGSLARADRRTSRPDAGRIPRRRQTWWRSDRSTARAATRSAELIAELEQIGLVYFDDFFELSGNWPEWLRIHASGAARTPIIAVLRQLVRWVGAGVSGPRRSSPCQPHS